jgi:hypothetical protein
LSRSQAGKSRKCSTSQDISKLLALHRIANSFRCNLRLTNDLTSIRELLVASGWSSLGIFDAAIAWREPPFIAGEVPRRQQWQLILGVPSEAERAPKIGGRAGQLQ